MTPNKVIAKFTPSGLTSTQWAVVADFTREVVRSCDPETSRRASLLMTAVSRLAHWSHTVACLPLTTDVVLHRDTIAEYIESDVFASRALGTRSTHRSALLRAAESSVRPPMRVSRLRPLFPRNTAAPYTPDEEARLRFWARSQSTRERRIEFEVLLALGLGAGLRAGDMLALRTQDVQEDGSGVVVNISGATPRVVPVLPAWSAALLKWRRDREPDSLVVLPRREGMNPNAINTAITRSTGPFKPDTRRMRNTWLTWHLCAGADLRALMAASRLHTTESLDRLMAFLDPPACPDDLREALRHEDGGRR